MARGLLPPFEQAFCDTPRQFQILASHQRRIPLHLSNVVQALLIGLSELGHQADESGHEPGLLPDVPERFSLFGNPFIERLQLALDCCDLFMEHVESTEMSDYATLIQPAEPAITKVTFSRSMPEDQKEHYQVLWPGFLCDWLPRHS